MSNETILLENIQQQPEKRIVGLSVEIIDLSEEYYAEIKKVHLRMEEYLEAQMKFGELKKLTKYGITYNSSPGGPCFYLIGIDKSEADMEFKQLTTKLIPECQYAHFIHCGNILDLQKTIHSIYNKWLPDSDYHLVPAWKCGLDYFEKYNLNNDKKSSEAIVDIYLPIRPKEKL